MIVRLNAKAISTLIEEQGEDVRVELTRAVVAEVARKTLAKDAGLILSLIAPEIRSSILKSHEETNWVRAELQKALDSLLVPAGTTPFSYKPSAATKMKLDDAVRPVIEDYLREVRMAASARAEEVFEASKKELDERVQKRVDRLTDEYIEAEVRRRVKARMDAAVAGLQQG